MITREEIIKIYDERERRLNEWVNNNPKKKTIPQLKKDLKKWQNEITDAQELAKVNDPLFPKDNLGSAYTFMNVSNAIYANYVIALVYIKKLEFELKKLKSKKTKI